MNYIALVIVSLTFASCASVKVEEGASSTSLKPISIHGILEREIPKYPNTSRNFLYYDLVKQKEKQLGLKSIEFEGAEFTTRIWATIPMNYKQYLGIADSNSYVDHSKQFGYLIEIVKDQLKFHSRAVFYRVNWSKTELTESIESFDSNEILGFSEWEKVDESLKLVDWWNIPTDEDLPDFDTITTAYRVPSITYCFEVANKQRYRFFQYTNVFNNSKYFPEVRAIESFIVSIAKSLDPMKYGVDYVDGLRK